MKISKRTEILLNNLIESAKNYSFDEDQGELDTAVDKLIKHLSKLEKKVYEANKLWRKR